MPQKKEKDSFTFSEKLRSTETTGTLSKRIPSRLVGSGKVRKTLLERVRRDAPYYITALLLLLILPLLGKFDGFVTDDGIFVPGEEMVDASSLRTAYGSLGIVEGELVGEGEVVSEFTGRNPLDLIAGRQAKKAERKKVTKVTYDLVEPTSARETRDAWKGGAIKKVVQRPTTSIGTLSRTFSAGSGSGGTSTSGVIPTGPRGKAYSGVSLRSSTKPVAHYPLNVKGKRGGEKLYSEAARSLEAMSKSGAATALKEAQLDSAGGVGHVGGISSLTGMPTESAGGAHAGGKFSFGALTPWWWELEKIRDKKWLEIEFKAIGLGIDAVSKVSLNTACCLLFGDSKCEKYVHNKGGSGGSEAKCCGYTESEWSDNKKGDWPGTKSKCEDVPKKDKWCSWTDAKGASKGKTYKETRKACLGIADKAKSKEANDCTKINESEISFKAEFDKKHSKDKWKPFHVVLAKLDDHDEVMQARYDRSIKDLNITGLTGLEDGVKKAEEKFFTALGHPTPLSEEKRKKALDKFVIIEKEYKEKEDVIKEINRKQKQLNFYGNIPGVPISKTLRKKTELEAKFTYGYKKTKEVMKAYKDFREVASKLQKAQDEKASIEKKASEKLYVIYIAEGAELDYGKLKAVMKQKGYRKNQLKEIKAWATTGNIKEDGDIYYEDNSETELSKLLSIPLPMKKETFEDEYLPKKKSGDVKCPISLTNAKIKSMRCPSGIQSQQTMYKFSAKITNPDDFVYAVLTEDRTLVPDQNKDYPIIGVNDFSKAQGTAKKEKDGTTYTTEPMHIGVSSGTIKGSGRMHWISSSVDISDKLKLGKDLTVAKKEIAEKGSYLDNSVSTYVTNSDCSYNIGCDADPCGDESNPNQYCKFTTSDGNRFVFISDLDQFKRIGGFFNILNDTELGKVDSTKVAKTCKFPKPCEEAGVLKVNGYEIYSELEGFFRDMYGEFETCDPWKVYCKYTDDNTGNNIFELANKTEGGVAGINVEFVEGSKFGRTATFCNDDGILKVKEVIDNEDKNRVLSEYGKKQIFNQNEVLTKLGINISDLTPCSRIAYQFKDAENTLVALAMDGDNVLLTNFDGTPDRTIPLTISCKDNTTGLFEITTEAGDEFNSKFLAESTLKTYNINPENYPLCTQGEVYVYNMLAENGEALDKEYLRITPYGSAGEVLLEDVKGDKGVQVSFCQSKDDSYRVLVVNKALVKDSKIHRGIITNANAGLIDTYRQKGAFIDKCYEIKSHIATIYFATNCPKDPMTGFSFATADQGCGTANTYKFEENIPQLNKAIGTSLLGDEKFLVLGGASNSGDAKNNFELSQRRMAVVKTYLEDPASRAGFGADASAPTTAISGVIEAKAMGQKSQWGSTIALMGDKLDTGTFADYLDELNTFFKKTIEDQNTDDTDNDQDRRVDIFVKENF